MAIIWRQAAGRWAPQRLLGRYRAAGWSGGGATVRKRKRRPTPLWKATADAEHLASAWGDLEALRETAPPEDRDRMLENVWLYREIAEARS